MGKLYTLDNELLTDVPEIKIGDIVIKVDDRQKTVKKAMAVIKNDSIEDENKIDEVFKIVLSEQDVKKIDNKNLSFAAYSELFKLVLSAMTGEDELQDNFRKQSEK